MHLSESNEMTYVPQGDTDETLQTQLRVIVCYIRPTLECRKTLGHIRSINYPNMIID